MREKITFVCFWAVVLFGGGMVEALCRGLGL